MCINISALRKRDDYNYNISYIVSVLSIWFVRSNIFKLQLNSQIIFGIFYSFWELLLCWFGFTFRCFEKSCSGRTHCFKLWFCISTDIYIYIYIRLLFSFKSGSPVYSPEAVVVIAIHKEGTSQQSHGGSVGNWYFEFRILYLRKYFGREWHKQEREREVTEIRMENIFTKDCRLSVCVRANWGPVASTEPSGQIFSADVFTTWGLTERIKKRDADVGASLFFPSRSFPSFPLRRPIAKTISMGRIEYTRIIPGSFVYACIYVFFFSYHEILEITWNETDVEIFVKLYCNNSSVPKHIEKEGRN